MHLVLFPHYLDLPPAVLVAISSIDSNKRLQTILTVYIAILVVSTLRYKGIPSFTGTEAYFIQNKMQNIKT